MRFIKPLFLLISSVALSGCSGLLPWSEKPAAQKEAAAKPAAVAAPAPRPVPAPPTAAERRRPIQSTGYAVISIQPHSLPAQQRILAIRAARLDAYRGLAEQVYGQFLDGATTIADAVLRSDRVRARVEGIIHGAEVVSIMPVGQDTYELTLSLDRDVVRELRAIYLEETRAQVR